MPYKIVSLYALIVLLFSNLSHAKDLVLSLATDKGTQKSIYQKYVARTGLHKKGPDAYHVTVGWVKNIHPKDYKGLKKFMEKRLAAYKKNPVFFQPSFAHYYTVGGRNPNQSPIVLYPGQKSTARFKQINTLLLKDLRAFKAPSGKKYTFISDVMPQNYNPHITLANTAHLSATRVQKKPTLALINKKVKANPVPIKMK